MNTEPVRRRAAQTAGGTAGAVGVVLLAAQILSAFGIDLTGEQIAALSAVAAFVPGTLLPLFLGGRLRNEVTPYSAEAGAQTPGPASDPDLSQLKAALQDDLQEEVESLDPDDSTAYEVVYDPVTGEPV